MLVKWKKIPLTQGKFAIVDPEDYEVIMQWKWYFTIKGYAARTVSKKTIFMHRIINNTQTGFITDHINGNKLDNRKTNLRICTGYQNQASRGKQTNNTSGFKGVSLNKKQCMYIAMICTHGKQIYLGRFTSAIEAARAYNEAAIKYHGEFAKLNEL